MYDYEIKNYLDRHNWSVNADEGLSDIFNTSPQIKKYWYNPDDKTMTVVTQENTFVFKWNLKVFT